MANPSPGIFRLSFLRCLVSQSNSRLAKYFPDGSLLTVTDFSFHPSGSYGGALFLPAASLWQFQEPVLQTDIPIYYIRCIGFPRMFLIYNAEIHSWFPEKFPKAPSRFNCTFASARESTSFSHGYSFISGRRIFQHLFPDNNGFYPQASGYKENDCSRSSSI